MLLPKGKTPSDHAPDDGNKHEKFVYVVNGQMECVVDNEAYSLKVGDSISFDCTKPHHFENKNNKACKFIVTENPARY